MQPHDEPLLDLVSGRLAGSQVPDQAARLVLAAYAGQAQLRAALAGEDTELPSPAGDRGPRAQALYLEAITAAGFRGIGPSASVRLQPRPGLTLIVGRNGSGKSSFAEAAELCLTGDSPRWSDKNSVFREGWRNLHHGSPCQIQVVLRADGGTAPVRVTRAWNDADTQPEQAALTVSAGGRQHASLAALGWQAALGVYRPFLTAGDFGRLISATPSTLFDALSPILGLDPLTDADKHLMHARKEISDRQKDLKSSRDSLRAALAAVDDDRAGAAAAILARRQPDLDELDAVLAIADDTGADPVAAACRRLAHAAMPDPAAIRRAADELDAATAGLMAVAGTDSMAAQQAAALLEAALAFHADHGDGPCPVCQTGRLDPRWRSQAASSLARMHAEAEQARAAGQRRAAAVRDAGTFLATSPGWPTIVDLRTAAPALGNPAAEFEQALQAWQEMATALTAEQVPERLRLAYPSLHAAFLTMRQAAADWLQRRHDAWREPSAELQAWLTLARELAGDDVLLARITAARTWIRAVTEEIRASRLAPFAERSQQIWEQLRQESNVELSGMRLDGASTRRRVVFPATVDGTATQAMAVMSHGELQALGLAVFLPRACADDSPFRFVLIDDPVHSMDPSKVDGLARVLGDLAADRQVIVFTHDNRLPEAVRRLEIDATIWEVTRSAGSAVVLRKSSDPVTRYLDDAWALACTQDIAAAVRGPVVAGFCRSAIEAACHERIRRDQLARGARHGDVDALIDRAKTLTDVVAIALLGSASQGGKVLTRLNSDFGGWAADVFRTCQTTVHGGGDAALKAMVEDTRRLAVRLR